jgi:hypothetical protein
LQTVGIQCRVDVEQVVAVACDGRAGALTDQRKRRRDRPGNVRAVLALPES